MIYKSPIEAKAPDLAYTRTGAGTAWRKDGTLAQFAANVIRRTDAGVTIEGQRTNLFARWDPTAAQIAVGGRVINCSDAPAPALAPLAGRNWIALDNSNATACAWAACQSIPVSTLVTCSFFVETQDGSQPVWGTGVTTDIDFHLRTQNGANLDSGSASYVRRAGNIWEVRVTGTTPNTLQTTQFGLNREAILNKRPLKFSGFQLELGTLASTPIITTGAAATVGADNLALAKTIAAGEDFTFAGSAVFDGVGASDQYVFETNSGTNSNRLGLYRAPSGSTFAYLTANGVSAASPATFKPGARTLKWAVGRKGDTYSLALDGALIWSGTTPGMAPLTSLGIGRHQGAGRLGGILPKTLLFPYALTDAELVSMTQPTDTSFNHLPPGGVFYYPPGNKALPRGSQVVAPISSGRELIL